MELFKKHVGLFCLLVGGLCVAGLARAGTLTWTWQNATTFEDNSPLLPADITQTRIEYGTCSGTAFGTKMGEVINAGNGITVSKTGVPAGTYCSRAFTTAKGKESLASNVTSSLIDQSNPKPPVLATVATAAFVPVYNKMWNYWAMADQVGTVKLGTECNQDVSYGNGFYALKDPKDVTYYHGKRARKVIAAQCG